MRTDHKNGLKNDFCASNGLFFVKREKNLCKSTETYFCDSHELLLWEHKNVEIEFSVEDAFLE
jgi:hypothetical protein